MALRAGNEKDEDQADTVGCCSLRVEHIRLEEELNGKEYVVVFDFLGKDSIRYYNEVSVEKRVFKNLQLFMENKDGKDDLFDRLNVSRWGHARNAPGFYAASVVVAGTRGRLFGGSWVTPPVLPDHDPEQAPERADGGSDGQGVPHVQRLADSAGAAGPAHRG